MNQNKYLENEKSCYNFLILGEYKKDIMDMFVTSGHYTILQNDVNKLLSLSVYRPNNDSLYIFGVIVKHIETNKVIAVLYNNGESA